MVVYKKGNLLESNCDIICHQVNCKRAMGNGIAGQIRQKWPKVYEDYCYNIDYMYENNFVKQSSDLLGMISWTELEGNKYVMNFFSQDEYYPRDRCHTDYEAFTKCCKALKDFITEYNLDKSNTIIGFPYKIGCGLAGGNWDVVSAIIEREFEGYEVEIYVYEG
jgi:O-acetyl-ADP-ribose deacetylase (regulator of RNase III)